MADCSTLLDEDLESFVFNYLTDSPEPGEEPLSLDFPEIDLSQLDASDFDSNSCFNELQWCNNHSENDSSQYSTDDSELLQIIDSENEALLAALTQTLDDIQEDDISLSAFISSGDGDFCPLPALSAKTSFPCDSPKSPETEDELSILKKLLLSPAQTPVNSDIPNDGNVRRQGTTKFRPLRVCSKVESPTDRQTGLFQTQSRSCTELHRHLVSTGPQTAVSSSKEDNQDSSKEEDSDSNDDENNEDDSVNSSSSPNLENHKPQFTCEREKRAVVDLIRYMHTYCLPIKKQPSNEKHQHCNTILKRPKLESTRQTSPCSNEVRKMGLKNDKGNCPSFSKCKWTGSGFSILKELLAKDISGDVSKPYRLAQPVYASLSDSCVSSLSHGKEGLKLGLGASIKTELEKVHKSCPALKKDIRHVEVARKPPNASQEHFTVKTAPKQESSVYAVRRSSRLNPEFSELLWFNEDMPPQTCVEQIAADVELVPAVKAFDEDEQIAEVEVEELLDPTDEVDIARAEVLENDSHELHANTITKQFCPQETPRCQPLSLPQSDSTFEKRNYEQGLSVELCGTAGLTPPTTPPYKHTEEDHYKPEINHNSEPLSSSPSNMEAVGEPLSINRKHSRKHPERTELYAHLSRTSDPPGNYESQGLKRPFSRTFGDHDYCQVKKSDTGFQRKILTSLDLPSYMERKLKQHVIPAQQTHVEIKNRSIKGGNKLLKDHEIRASLTKHFGFPDNNLKEESNGGCNSPKYDSVFEYSDSECSSPTEDLSCLTPHRTKIYAQGSPPPKNKLQCCPRTRSSLRSSRHSSPESRSISRCDSNEKQQQTENVSQRQIKKRREKAINEGRVIYIRNLSSNMSANELKKRFEVFGEITECRVLSRNRGEKYGFITYRCSEHAALSLKKGASLRKKSEPSFHLSYGGLRHFFWTKYTDLDSHAESSPALTKSKYESMDFDSLLKEAQRSLHR